MKNYLLIGTYVMTLLLSGGYIIKTKSDQMKSEEISSTLNMRLMEANLKVGRAETKFGSASKHVENLEKKLREEIDDRNAMITRFGKLKAKYDVAVSDKTKTRIEIKDSIIYNDCGNPDLEEGRLYVAKDNGLGPLGTFTAKHKDHRIFIGCAVDPRVSSTGDLPVVISYTLNLKLKAEVLETVTPTGAINNYIRLYEVDDKGRIVGTFDIQSFDMIVDDQRSPKFLWWDPHMDMGVSLGLRSDSSIGSLEWEGTGSIGFTAISYGLSSKDLAWRFGRLSLGVGREISIGLAPVLYNIGNDLPVFTNLWLGAIGHYGLGSNKLGFGLTLGANL